MPAEGLYVLDACAAIAFLQREPGAEVVAGILKDPQSRCLIHAVNVCEVYYDTYRRTGAEDAAALEDLLVNTGIEIVESIPLENGTVLTSDHHELDPIAQAAVCPIRFIR